jgi:hypothetical protein
LPWESSEKLDVITGRPIETVLAVGVRRAYPQTPHTCTGLGAGFCSNARFEQFE